MNKETSAQFNLVLVILIGLMAGVVIGFLLGGWLAGSHYDQLTAYWQHAAYKWGYQETVDTKLDETRLQLESGPYDPDVLREIWEVK